MDIENNNEKILFVLSGFEMEELKNHSRRLLKYLPEDANNALLTITFLKEHMETVIGRKVEGIKIINKKSGGDD